MTRQVRNRNVSVITVKIFTETDRDIVFIVGSGGGGTRDAVHALFHAVFSKTFCKIIGFRTNSGDWRRPPPPRLVNPGFATGIYSTFYTLVVYNKM